MGYDFKMIIAILKLGTRGIINKIIVDTLHYKGNYPESCEILVFNFFTKGIDETEDVNEHSSWVCLMERKKLTAHKEHEFIPTYVGPFTHVKLLQYPDGGISRLRLIGSREDCRHC
jgi:allantoicase